MENHPLQKEFVEGTVPDSLEGFYRGSIEEVYDTNVGKTFISAIGGLWSPWKGKYFYQNGRGDNIMSAALKWLVKIRFGDFFNEKQGDGFFHAYPFQTSISVSIYDEKPVLQLSYNLPQNPPSVQAIIDEIVWTGEKIYLGKMYVKTQETYKLKAWFRLYAP